MTASLYYMYKHQVFGLLHSCQTSGDQFKQVQTEMAIKSEP